jgi:hypothetical protein
MPMQAAEDNLLVGSRDGKITHWNLQVRSGHAVFRWESHSTGRFFLMDKSTVVDFPSNHVLPEVRSDAFALFSCADWQAAKLPSA